MSGFGTVASYAFSVIFTYILSKFGQRFVWGNKKVDGTNKSPWAPSPSGLPYLTKGYTAFQQNTYHALTQWYEQLGDLFSVVLGQKRIVVLNTPELVREALIEKEQLNSSRIPSDTFEKILTDQCKTVYTAPFATYWTRLRRSIYIVVGRLHVSQFNKFFKDQAKKLSFGIQESSNDGKLTSKELRQLVDMIAIDSALTLVFGASSSRDPVAMLTLLQKFQDLESFQSQKYNRMAQFFSAVNAALDLKNLFTLNAAMVNKRNSLLETVWPWFEPVYQLRGNDQPISEEERKALRSSTKLDAIAKSLLYVEPSKNDPEPVPLTKDEILSNSVHITLHAYTYLSSALFTLVQRLATEPEWQEQLKEAQDTELYYAFVKESLRLDTPTQILAYGPRADYDFEVQDKLYRVDEDTPVVVNVYAVHRNERFYPNPEAFDPQRFMKVDKKTTPLMEVDQTGKKTARDHLAFGAGRRACIGGKASEEFLVASLVQLVKHYRLKGGDVKEKVELTSNVWSWTGRTETKGASIEFEKRA